MSNRLADLTVFHRPIVGFRMRKSLAEGWKKGRSRIDDKGLSRIDILVEVIYPLDFISCLTAVLM